MMRWMWVACWGVVLGVMWTATPASRAEAQAVTNDERARSHFLAGSSYFDQRRFREAAEQFMEAYRLSDRAALLLNAATAYDRANLLPESAETLRLYLEVAAADDPQRATAEMRLSAIQNQLAEQERQRAAADDGGEETAESETAETETPEEPAIAADARVEGSAPATEDGLGGLGIARAMP